MVHIARMVGARIFHMGNTQAERFAAALLAVAGYFAVAATTISLTSDGRSHATVWPADAVILALLLNSPKRHWPLILLAGWGGNFLANGVTRGWTAGILLYGAINMGQVYLAARFLRRSGAGENLLADMGSVGRFILWAGVVAPAIGAAAGSLVSWFNYGQPFGPSFARWYASNALGLLVCTPFFQALLTGGYTRCFVEKTWRQRAEAAVLIAGHTALALLVFWQARVPLLFLFFPSLLILAFRLGRLGTMAGVMIVAAVGVSAALHGQGPIALVQHDLLMQAVFFQIYLAVLLGTALPVATIVASRMEALTSLAEREEMLRFIMAHSPDAILHFDAEGMCRWADGPLEEVLGLDARGLMGLSLEELALRTGDTLMRLNRAAGSDRGSERIAEFSPSFRSNVTLEASVRRLGSAEHPLGTVIALRDITARKAKEIAISRRAETDDLTGVLNRAGFRKRMEIALRDTSRPTALALVDVDRFKSINDSHGHPSGDAVLAEIARRLKAGMREDDIVARLGGDEFAILFRCDLETARAACERVAQAIASEPVRLDDGYCVHASISCGVAWLRPGGSRDQLFNAADEALYDVKRAGRNGVRAAA